MSIDLTFGEGATALLNVTECAARLRASQSFVRRHRHGLGAIYVGRSLRFDASAIEARCTARKTLFIVPAGKTAPEAGEEFSMAERRWQRGSVSKTKSKNAVWIGRYREDFRTQDGAMKRRMRRIEIGSVREIPTKTQAERALAQLIAREPATRTELTFKEAVSRWQENVQSKNGTGRYYGVMLRNHLLPWFGNFRVADISKFEVEKFIARKAEKYSRSTVKGARVALGVILGWCESHGWVEKTATLGVRLPKPENCGGVTRQRNVISQADCLRLIAELEAPYATLVLLLAVTGLRVGEACSLRWEDLDGQMLHVRRNLKTRSSRRSLPLSEGVVSRLNQLPRAGETIFASRDGTPLNAGNIRNRYLRPACQKLGIAISGFHDFRHTAVTRLLNDGVNPKTVAAIAGHSDVRVTLNVYAHVETDQLKAPLERLSCALVVPLPKEAA